MQAQCITGQLRPPQASKAASSSALQSGAPRRSRLCTAPRQQDASDACRQWHFGVCVQDALLGRYSSSCWRQQEAHVRARPDVSVDALAPHLVGDVILVVAPAACVGPRQVLGPPADTCGSEGQDCRNSNHVAMFIILSTLRLACRPWLIPNSRHLRSTRCPFLSLSEED